MKKSMKKDERKRERSRSLTLNRETILTLADPLLEFALGGDEGVYDPIMPTSSGGPRCQG